MQYLCRKRQKQDMNQLDLFLGFVVLFFALGGLFGGAVRRVIQIAALIIAFREAWRLAPWVESVLGGGDGQSISGWGFIFALVYIGIRLMGNWFSSLTKGTFLSVIDRIKWGGGSLSPPKPAHLPSSTSRKAPPNAEQQQAIIQQDSPSRGVTKNLSQGELKRTSTGHRSEQYWSRLRPVLVTTTDQYWSHRRPVLVDFLLPHRIPQVQLIPMQLFALELW